MGVCARCCESALTDGVSGPSRISGDGERTKSKSVLSSDPEQVVLAFKKSWDHVGLTGTSGIHLIKSQSNPQLINHNKKSRCFLRRRFQLPFIVLRQAKEILVEG